MALAWALWKENPNKNQVPYIRFDRCFLSHNRCRKGDACLFVCCALVFSAPRIRTSIKTPLHVSLVSSTGIISFFRFFFCFFCLFALQFSFVLGCTSWEQVKANLNSSKRHCFVGERDIKQSCVLYYDLCMNVIYDFKCLTWDWVTLLPLDTWEHINIHTNIHMRWLTLIYSLVFFPWNAVKYHFFLSLFPFVYFAN